MTILIVILAVLVLATMWLYLSNKIELPTAVRDEPQNFPTTKEALHSGAKPTDYRFATSLRGYRMDQVDAAMQHLEEVVEKQEEELQKLRAPWK